MKLGMFFGGYHMISYKIYTLTNSTPHQFLKPGQCGVNYGGYLVTTNDVDGISIFKTYNVSKVETGSQFYIKLAFDNRGENIGGIRTGTSSKSLCIDDAVKKIESFYGITFKIIKQRFVMSPDKIRNCTIKNCFEIYGEISSISDKEQLVEKIKIGLGSRKSYGFGQMVLFNNTMEETVCRK
jgi:hypothetical protein